MATIQLLVRRQADRPTTAWSLNGLANILRVMGTHSRLKLPASLMSA
jgi:hypothetical protein